MDKEKPSEQVLASPTLNPNSGKPTASPRETAAVSLTPNVTNARVYTRYVPGTSARIKVAGDDVAALLQKPRGKVSKEEITGLLEKLSRMEAGGEPLQGAEFLNRQSLFMAVVTRGVSEGLLTPQEVTSYRVFNQAAVGAMAMSGGGAKVPGRGIPRTGPELPRTGSSTVAVRNTAGSTGVVVLKPHIKISQKISAQKQKRHLEGSAPAGKSYMKSSEDAQKVLDATRSGEAEVLKIDSTKNSIVVKVKDVEGVYLNTGNPNGLPDVIKSTNIFMIQGGDKVVPVNPAKGF